MIYNKKAISNYIVMLLFILLVAGIVIAFFLFELKPELFGAGKELKELMSTSLVIVPLFSLARLKKAQGPVPKKLLIGLVLGVISMLILAFYYFFLPLFYGSASSSLDLFSLIPD